MDQLPSASSSASVPGNLPAELEDRRHLLVGDAAYLAKLQTEGALTEVQWQALETYFRESAAAPVQPSILCKDTECPYFESCPLVRAQVPRPVGKPCVVEDTVKRNWAALYYAEIGVAEDGYAAVDRGVVIDLMNTMLDIKRAQDELASGDRGSNSVITQRDLKGWTKDNEPIVELKVNPIHVYLKNARLIKSKLLESLIATRESRAKNKHQKTTTAASLMTELAALIKQVSQVPMVEESVTDAEFSVSPDSESKMSGLQESSE